MNIQVDKVLEVDNLSAIVRCCGDYIVVTTPGDVNTVCKIQLFISNRKKDVLRIAEWQIPGADDLGNIVAVDSVNNIVYAVHQDSANVSVLFSSKGQNELTGTRQVIALPFQGTPLDIVRFTPGEHSLGGDILVVVSARAEISVLQATASLSVSLFKAAVSYSGPVSTVSKHGRNSLVLTGVTEKSIDVRVIMVEILREASGCLATEKPPVRLLKPKTTASVLGCAVQPQSIFVLFSDGTFHAFRSESYSASFHKGSLNSWWGLEISAPTEPEPEKLRAPTSTFKLLSQPSRVTGASEAANKIIVPTGNVCAVGDHYVAVAYGRFCSIWDAVYHADHGFTELSQPISSLHSSSEFGEVLLETNASTFSMQMDSITDKCLTLAEAIRRRGSCESIWTSGGKSSVLHAQPVMVSLTKSVADSGGDCNRVFQKHLSANDAAEALELKKIFSRSKISTADELSTLIKKYVKEYGKIRRGNYGDLSNLGLSQLPSPLVASATCARSLYEIAEGNLEFVAPFIDMVGTGVVSNEPVLASLCNWASKLNDKQLNFSSIATILAKTPQTLYALEAAVVGISDLPESDIVRAAQMATRSYVSVKKQRVELNKACKRKRSVVEAQELTVRRRLNNSMGVKAHRVFLRCLTAPVDRVRLMTGMRKIPQHDVRNMLAYFQDILDHFATRRDDPFHEAKGSKVNKRGKVDVKFSSQEEYIAYRGVGHWLDCAEVSSGKINGRPAENQELDGCIKWASLILDAHLASIVLDEDGRKSVQSLLESVTFQRKQSEAVVPITGTLDHIMGDLPLPIHKPLFLITEHDVPMFASLQ